MATYLDTPPGRLHAAFEAVRQQHHSTHAADAWATVFETKRNSAGFFRCVTELLEMAEFTRKFIERLDDVDPEIYLKHFGQVEATVAKFETVGSLQIGQFLSDLDPRSGEYSLEICSDALHRRGLEQSIPDERRAELVELVANVLAEVEGSDDLDSVVKSWVIESLNEVLFVLRRSVVFGLNPVRRANEVIVGGFVTKRERVSALARSKVGAKVAGLIVALDLAINLGANSLQINDSFSDAEPSKVVVEIRNEIIQNQIEVSGDTLRLLPGAVEGDSATGG